MNFYLYKNYILGSLILKNEDIIRNHISAKFYKKTIYFIFDINKIIY